MYRKRYSDLPPDRFNEIPNGIDDTFAAEASHPMNIAAADGPIVLLHSGLMEIPDRDPTAFFRALRMLVEQRALPERPLRIVLRASGREAQFRVAAEAEGVGALVNLAPRLPYGEALEEMRSATGLLLFQGNACNRQIPAKAYEYLVTQRPIVGLMDPRGDTHALVHGKWNVPYCADMADPKGIASTLQRFFADIERGTAFVPDASLINAYIRKSQAGELARLLDSVCSGRAVESRAEDGLGYQAARVK